jgi:hypothetical protein
LAGLGLGRHLHSLTLLGLTSGAGASRFEAAPDGLLSPLACSLPIYLVLYYLCHLQMIRSSSCPFRQRTGMPVSSLPLLLYQNLEVGEMRDGISDLLSMVAMMSAFRPRGVPGPTSELSPRVPAQMGRRKTEHKRGEKQQRGNPRPPCCPAPRSGALAVGGYKRSRGRERERERLSASPFSRAANPLVREPYTFLL